MSVALLIAESAWFSPKENKKQANFTPYADAIESLVDLECKKIFNCYKTVFYDATSLTCALEHLCKTDEKRQILYIGAHGDGERLASVKLKKVGEIIAGNGKKIKGVIISSCWAGENDKLIKTIDWGIGSNSNIVNGPNWVFTYKYSVDWHLSAVIEQRLLYVMSTAYCSTPEELNSKTNIIDKIEEALNIFNPDLPIAGEFSLKDTIRVWVRGQGAEFSKEVTSELLEQLEW